MSFCREDFRFCYGTHCSFQWPVSQGVVVRKNRWAMPLFLWGGSFVLKMSKGIMPINKILDLEDGLFSF
jgi:hypothetical protein